MTDPTASAGDAFGRWRVRRLLARTRMSTLYLADDGAETVVVKVLRPSLARRGAHLTRFRDEGAVCAAIEHPNVVRALDRGGEGDCWWIAFERLDGVSVARLMASCTPERGLEPAAWAWLASRAARGLAAVHDLTAADGRPLHLLHGDVSPGNLFVTSAGDVVVLDLGLVRPAGRRDPSPHPSGTLAYLAPERVTGGLVDHRADVFALGVVLYEATTFRRLFKGTTDRDTLANIRAHRIRPPHLCVSGYPRRLEGAVLRALVKDRLGRWPSIAEMGRALARWAESEGVGPAPPAELIERVATLRGRCEDAR